MSLNYGINLMWPTPILRLNLLEMRLVNPELHAYLKAYADRPELVSADQKNTQSHDQLYTRYNYEPFNNLKEPELRTFKDIVMDIVDQYTTSAAELEKLPEHTKLTYMWFVIQHSNNMEEAVHPHHHEGSDTSFCYYLNVPTNNSGQIAFTDPRGCIGRGGFVIPRHVPFAALQPVEGDLVVFPRYAMHYTTPNTDTLDRKVIAGSVQYNRV